MSKRYGRNQKRKHRERIAELEKQNGKLWRDWSAACGRVEKLRFELKELLEAIDSVQPLSALLKPTLIHLDSEMFRGCPFQQAKRLPFRQLNVDSSLGSIPLETIQHWLHEITAEIRANPQGFQHTIHLIARSPRDYQKTDYFVDSEALAKATSLPHVFSSIFEKMIRSLVDARQTGVVRGRY